jgi:hypothetical protein
MFKGSENAIILPPGRSFVVTLAWLFWMTESYVMLSMETEYKDAKITIQFSDLSLHIKISKWHMIILKM